MTLTITKNMNGRKVESIGTFTIDEIDKMDAAFEKWKKDQEGKGKYRVQWYNRVLFYKDKCRIVIDFGDYTYFGLVKANKKEWKALMEHQSSAKVNLDV